MTDSLSDFIEEIMLWSARDKFLNTLKIKKSGEFSVELNPLQITKWSLDYNDNGSGCLKIVCCGHQEYMFRADEKLKVSYYKRNDVKFKVDAREKRRLELLKKRLGE